MRKDNGRPEKLFEGEPHWGFGEGLRGTGRNLHIFSQHKCSKDHSLPGEIQTAALVKVSVSDAFCFSFSCRSANLPSARDLPRQEKVWAVASQILKTGAGGISGLSQALIEASWAPMTQLRNK